MQRPDWDESTQGSLLIFVRDNTLFEALISLRGCSIDYWLGYKDQEVSTDVSTKSSPHQPIEQLVNPLPIPTMSGPKVAIVIYTMYGHIAKSQCPFNPSPWNCPRANSLTYSVAEAAKKGIEDAGGHATILQVPETLPQDVLNKMYAPPKPDYPIATPADLVQYDGFIFGVSTRFGNWSAQFKSFWDASGQLWATGALHGKFASTFVSTAGPGGGQESTFFSTFSTLAHHGIIFVPLVRANPLTQSNPLTVRTQGYKNTTALWNSHFDEVHGGSPFGAGECLLADSEYRSLTKLSRAQVPFL
jgi:NAD(P)H dehydrogenase (quinone)